MLITSLLTCTSLMLTYTSVMDVMWTSETYSLFDYVLVKNFERVPLNDTVRRN